MPVALSEISIRGFKSIDRLEGFQPRPLNVFIGANGAGKSSFIGFFRFLAWMLTPPGQLQGYVANNGGASAFLHDGPAKTQRIQGELGLSTGAGMNEYVFSLFYAAGDAFRFQEERYRFTRTDRGAPANWVVLNPGVPEAGLNAAAESGDSTARTINRLIRRCIVHQFHNTSATSRMKQRWNIDDNQFLKEDGANLGPFLFRLQEHEPPAYRRIVETVRQVVPFFADFVLRPVGNSVLLQWQEVGSDTVFAAYQASDGMLRLFAILALLLQPDDTVPDVLLIDEPELGLHPHACEIVAGLLKGVATTKQVFVATQSTVLVDQFAPEDIVVVDRPRRASVFRRLSTRELRDWLDDFEGGRGYSLSELWEKNVLSAGPTP